MSNSFKNTRTVLSSTLNSTDDSLRTQSTIVDSTGTTASITDVAGKKAVDVNVVDLTLNSNNDSVSVAPLDLSVNIDFTSSTSFIYKGYAAVGSSNSTAVWKILRISLLDADAGTTKYANGNTNFSNIWNNRASYTYS